MSATAIALELYTVRDETARDFAGTLRRVAAMGYPAIEFAGYGGLSAANMVALLKETGLRVAATHVGLAALEQDIDAEIAYCRAIDCSYLILPWLPPDQRDLDTFRRLAIRMNEFGQRCHEQGITFGYHNHDFEFAQTEGHYLLDYLLDNTDPSFVQLELDVYWAAYAGVDPATYIRQRAGRIPVVHLKDMTPDRHFTEVGDGILHLDSVYQVAKESGCQWYVVENDAPQMPSLESARCSLENLRRIVG